MGAAGQAIAFALFHHQMVQLSSSCNSTEAVTSARRILAAEEFHDRWGPRQVLPMTSPIPQNSVRLWLSVGTASGEDTAVLRYPRRLQLLLLTYGVSTSSLRDHCSIAAHNTVLLVRQLTVH